MGKFNKGDFVRVRPGKGTALLKDEGIYEVLGHSVQGHPILPVTTCEGTRINLDYSAERLTLWRQAAEQPATLKIEVGRFYKTRDGRKAKIERSNYGDSYDFVGTVEGQPGNRVYKKDGKHGSYWIPNNPIYDLITEWIDEPAAKASNDNATPKLKVGDRVVVTCNKTNGGYPIPKYVIGETHPITSIIKDLNGKDAVLLNNHYQYLKQGQFAPESKPTTTTIVALIENGQPKPSSTPHVHTSTGAAETEAKRLAAKYKGKQFGVFTLTTTHEEAAPVYGHKWQNLAALGLKIDAIKELRDLSGLGLKSAKDAVEHFVAAA